MGDLQATLRGAGLRSTSPRIAALRVLLQARAPMSHAELFDELRDQGFDRATVYRNLIDMVEVGLLSRTDHGDHVWRFEPKLPSPHADAAHPHFVCIDCGGVACLPGVAVKITTTDRAPRSVSSKNFELQIKGRCDECG